MVASEEGKTWQNERQGREVVKEGGTKRKRDTTTEENRMAAQTDQRDVTKLHCQMQSRATRLLKYISFET